MITCSSSRTFASGSKANQNPCARTRYAGNFRAADDGGEHDSVPEQELGKSCKHNTSLQTKLRYSHLRLFFNVV